MMPISPFQYQEMLSRTNAVRRVNAEIQRSGEPVECESDLHDQIIKFCREQPRPWLYFHGSMAHKTYRAEGEPDFHIWADGGRKFAFECKSRGGKLSTKQLGVIVRAKQLGHTINTIGSMAEFRELVAASKMP